MRRLSRGVNESMLQWESDADLYEKLQQRFNDLQRAEQVSAEFDADSARIQRNVNERVVLDSASSHELLSDDVADRFARLGKLVESNSGTSSLKEAISALRLACNTQMKEAYQHVRHEYVEHFDRLRALQPTSQRVAGYPFVSGVAAFDATVRGGDSSRLHTPAVADVNSAGESLRTTNEGEKEEGRLGTSSQHAVSSPAASAKRLRKSRTEPTQPSSNAFPLSLHLLAESLATLLQCEAVRIYLARSADGFAGNGAEDLACCAWFPRRGSAGNPMNGDGLERVYARDVHNLVCNKCVAINGTLEKDHVHDATGVKVSDDEPSGVGAIGTCLIWPIVCQSSPNKAFGMIHAVNKRRCGQVINFDVKDELEAAHGARLLGCILSRYPPSLFAMAVSASVEDLVAAAGPGRAVFDTQQHLLPIVTDEVQGAAEVGNHSLHAEIPSVVYRAPISAVYQSRSVVRHPHKWRSYESEEKSMITVEFQIQAMNDLWKASYEENVAMHRECRRLEKKVDDSHELLCTVLDSLTAIRGMSTVDDVVAFVRPIELLARGENCDMLNEHVTRTMLSLRNGFSATKGSAAQPLTPQELEATIEKRDLRLAPHASKMHHDGPERVRHYTCDPPTKRLQVRFVADGLAASADSARVASLQSEKRNIEAIGNTVARSVRSSSPLPNMRGVQTSRKTIKTHGAAGPGDTRLLHAGSASDERAKRPFLLSRKANQTLR